MDDYHVILMPRATCDLEKIHVGISADSLLNADSMVQRILDAVDSLKYFPNRMVAISNHPRLRQAVRRLLVNPYLVYYRVIDRKKLVEILHVRHGARRQPKRFS
jgi:toxin ParE1/3/4